MYNSAIYVWLFTNYVKKERTSHLTIWTISENFKSPRAIMDARWPNDVSTVANICCKLCRQSQDKKVLHACCCEIIHEMQNTDANSVFNKPTFQTSRTVNWHYHTGHRKPSLCATTGKGFAEHKCLVQSDMAQHDSPLHLQCSNNQQWAVPGHVAELQLVQDLLIIRNDYFQQDGMPTHYTYAIQNYLPKAFRLHWSGQSSTTVTT